MDTSKIHEALKRAEAFARDPSVCPNQILMAIPDAIKQLRAIERVVKRSDRVRRIVWRMFDEGAPLDPYPTSDTSDEYLLRKATGWIPKDERKTMRRKND